MLVFVFALMLPCITHAQDAISVGTEYTLPVTVGDVERNSGDPSVSLVTVFANLIYPFRFESTNTMLLVGIDYRGTVPLVDNADAEIVDPFHEFGPRLGIIQSFGESWSLIAQVAPQLATNFKDVDGDHLRFTGLLILSYRFGPRFTLAGGVIASYVFGNLIPLPSIQIDWRITDTLRLNALLPSRLRLGWRVARWIELGFKTQLEGNRYIVQSDLVPIARQLVYTQANVSAFVDVLLYDPLWLSLWGGYTLFRNFDLQDNESNSIGDVDIDNAPIVGLSLVLRPPDDAE